MAGITPTPLRSVAAVLRDENHDPLGLSAMASRRQEGIIDDGDADDDDAFIHVSAEDLTTAIEGDLCGGERKIFWGKRTRSAASTRTTIAPVTMGPLQVIKVARAPQTGILRRAAKHVAAKTMASGKAALHGSLSQGSKMTMSALSWITFTKSDLSSNEEIMSHLADTSRFGPTVAAILPVHDTEDYIDDAATEKMTLSMLFEPTGNGRGIRPVLAGLVESEYELCFTTDADDMSHNHDKPDSMDGSFCLVLEDSN